MTPTKPEETTAIVPRSSRWERNMDRLRAILGQATDDEVIEILRVCMAEATERREHIMGEAQARLAKLDAILPGPGKIAPERREDLEPRSEPRDAGVSRPVSHEEPQTPKLLQCPAIKPDDVTMKCTQPRNHEGQHYNHKARVGWLKRT